MIYEKMYTMVDGFLVLNKNWPNLIEYNNFVWWKRLYYKLIGCVVYDYYSYNQTDPERVKLWLTFYNYKVKTKFYNYKVKTKFFNRNIIENDFGSPYILRIWFYNKSDAMVFKLEYM